MPIASMGTLRTLYEMCSKRLSGNSPSLLGGRRDVADMNVSTGKSAGTIQGHNVACESLLPTSVGKGELSPSAHSPRIEVTSE